MVTRCRWSSDLNLLHAVHVSYSSPSAIQSGVWHLGAGQLYDAPRLPCFEVLSEITGSAQNMLATTDPVRPCKDPCPYFVLAGYRA